jgi:hypothetical protein
MAKCRCPMVLVILSNTDMCEVSNPPVEHLQQHALHAGGGPRNERALDETPN